MTNTLVSGSILVTGGTGSFGKKLVETLLTRHNVRRIVVFSRDELKQFEMGLEPRFQSPKLRFFVGDVRDRERLLQAFRGIDYVVHAAALKQVPSCEYNPFEAIKTNVLGAQNIIDVAIERGVRSLVALSTDKACNPVNLYGATKLCSDKLFIAGNTYAGSGETRFSVVRYGNVVGSRGSVVPFFIKQRDKGILPVTHPDMTRFWITLQQGVDFVLRAFDRMRGGEMFVPKIPSMRIVDLAKAIAPGCELKFVGIRPGEKLHEVMISEDDARKTLEFGDHFVIQPDFNWWDDQASVSGKGGKAVKDGFRYSSSDNPEWLSIAQIKDMIQPIERELN